MTEETLVQLQEKVQNLEKRVSVLESTISSKQEIVTKSTRSKNLSLREFIEEKGANGDVQITLVAGYYLEHHRDMNAFNTEDIRKELSQAKFSPPQNINDKINMNIRKGGLMMEVEEKKNGKKSWKLTISGEKEVEKGFHSKQL